MTISKSILANCCGTMCDKRLIATQVAELEKSRALIVRAAFIAAKDELGSNITNPEYLCQWLNKNYPL